MYYKLKAMSRLFGDSKSNELKAMLIYDAMTPEFKAANAELLKAIKMNDKTGALQHSDLEAINKAMKSNDAVKVGEGLKKVQLKFKDAEKKLNEDLEDVTQRFSEAQKEVDSVKEKSKQFKSVQQLFNKAKTLVDSLKTSPKSASKITTITDKLKQYGDLSGKAQKVIQLVSAGKDASKQIDVLAKAVLAAEKKFKKEQSAFDKEFNKSRDAYIVLKERLKICKDKLSAFQKERLYIANVVKQMPQGDLRQLNKKNVPDEKVKAAYKEIENMLLNQYEQVERMLKEYPDAEEISRKASITFNRFYSKMNEKLKNVLRTAYAKMGRSIEYETLLDLLKRWDNEYNVNNLSAFLSQLSRKEENLPSLKPYLRGVKTSIQNFMKEKSEVENLGKHIENKYGIRNVESIKMLSSKTKLYAALITCRKPLIARIRELLKSIGEDPDNFIYHIHLTGKMPEP